MTSATNVKTTYRFGPLEKKGIIAGLRGGQIVMAAIAVVICLGIISFGTSNLSAIVIMFVLGLGFGAVFMQPAGRGIDEWVPLLLRWSLQVVRGRTRWVSPVPLLGTTFVEGKSKPVPIPLPDSLAGLEIIEVPLQDTRATVGMVKDNKEGTYTGVLAVRGTAFALLDNTEKERRLSAWGDVLSGLARPGSVIHRVQWIERTLPDDGDSLNRYLADSRQVDENSTFFHSYVDLLEEYGPENQQHETYVVVQLHAAKRAGRAIKKAGGGDGGAAEVMMRELKQLSYRLHEADIEVDGALTPRLLSRVFRTSIDPDSSPAIARRTRRNKDEEGVSPINAFPSATKTQWNIYQTDSAFHCTYWISEWPRLEVGPDFLAPLMIRSSRMRTVSLVMEPIDSSRASRDVEARRTSYMADEQLRSRAGYMSTKRREKEMEAIDRRESELASGFTEYRLSGYVTVSAMSLGELDEACNEVEQAAQQSRLELRRLCGEQDWAFTCTLPTARGLGKN